MESPSTEAPAGTVREEVVADLPFALWRHPGWAERFPWLVQGTTEGGPADEAGRPAGFLHEHGDESALHLARDRRAGARDQWPEADGRGVGIVVGMAMVAVLSAS